MMRSLFVFLLSALCLIGCSEDTQPTMYTLTVTVNPTEGGTFNTTGVEFEEGTEATIRVSPNTYYEFDKWSGSWSGSESPLTITMDSDKNIVGNFKLMDSDGDGVGDDIDICPDTRTGVPVDENGCMLNPIYLDDNGVTIKSQEWGIVGDIGVVRGVEYTIVDYTELRQKIDNGEDVLNICTSKVSNMNNLFSVSQFNGDISNWDVSNVASMGYMFSGSQFNGDISNWDVSNVASMEYMFSGSQFNGDISNWDVSNVADMSQMFWASKFISDISTWDVSNVANMSNMFLFSSFNRDISNWDVSNVVSMGGMFKSSQFNGDISNWDVSNVTNMGGVFDSSQFNGDISNWDVSNVTNMSIMFRGSYAFNQDLGSWDVSNVITCGEFSRDAFLWTLPKPNFTNCDPN